MILLLISWSRLLRLTTKFQVLYALCIFSISSPLLAQVETDLSAGGGVRIGDSTTTCDSSIAGAIRYDADGTNGFGYCNGSAWQDFATSTFTAIVNGGNSVGGTLTIGTNDAYNLAFETNNTTHMVIENGGNVGIGTTNPYQKFALVSTGSNTSNILLRSDNDVTLEMERILDNDASPSMVFRKARGTRSSPTIVNGGMTLGALSFNGHDGSGFVAAGGLFVEVDKTPGASDMPGRLIFTTTPDGSSSPVERMRIDSSGYVGIGTDSPTVALDVTGDIEYTGTITDVSDQRLKEDINRLDNALETLSQIEGVSFIMKEDPKRRVEFGVIAQQVEEIIPELVRTKNDEVKTKSVNYMGFIGWIIEAIKDLKQENIEQKQKIKELEAQLSEISIQLDQLESQKKGSLRQED